MRERERDEKETRKIHSIIDRQRDIMSNYYLVKTKYYEGVQCMCDITLQILQNWWMLRMLRKLKLQMKMTLLGHIELKIEKGQVTKGGEKAKESDKS